MDTTANIDTACKDWNLYYYQIKGKYPQASSTILKEVQQFLQHERVKYKGSGYITFRFKIDCAGNRMQKTQVMQTNDKYQSCHFDKAFVNELYLFLNRLNHWKIAKDPKGNLYSYTAFISYKITDGKVVTVIP